MAGPQRDVAYRRKSAEQRKRDLIDAGITCLGQGGISAFTVDRICSEAQVSRGLINHHFKSKEDLLVAICAELTAHLIEDRCRNDASARLRAIIEDSFDAASFNTANLRAWLAIWAEVGNNAALNALHRDRYRSYTARISSALEEIAGERGLAIDGAGIARQVVALIDGLWLEYCLHSEGFSLDDARRDCIGLLRAHGIDLDPERGAAGQAR